MKLTYHFDLEEFIKPGTSVPKAHFDNLVRLANRLEALRGVLGKPIKITSGYRTPAQNRAVGGASASRHLEGLAADLLISNEDQKKLNLDNWSGGYGKGNGWCHLDIDESRPSAKFRRWSY